MSYRVLFAPDAREDYRSLKARTRSEVRDAIERHLVHQPTRVGRSRIKRLRGIRKPQYHLRVGNVRVFCDVAGSGVHVLAVVEKQRADTWLKNAGVYDEESSTG